MVYSHSEKSCLLVGKVIVQGLEVKETQVMDFRRPVRCVVLDPEYAKSSSRRVVSGGMAGQLILSEKGTQGFPHRLTVGWFGNSETTLHSGEGPIYAISWRGPYIAWANDAVQSRSWKNETDFPLGGENMASALASTNNIHRKIRRRTKSRSVQMSPHL